MSESYVYFISDELGGDIKIGYSTDPESRLENLQVGNSRILKILALVPGGKYEEAELHRKFSHLRVPGRKEWFSRNDELMNYVNDAAKGNKVVDLERTISIMESKMYELRSKIEEYSLTESQFAEKLIVGFTEVIARDLAKDLKHLFSRQNDKGFSVSVAVCNLVTDILSRSYYHALADKRHYIEIKQKIESKTEELVHA